MVVKALTRGPYNIRKVLRLKLSNWFEKNFAQTPEEWNKKLVETDFYEADVKTICGKSDDLSY